MLDITKNVVIIKCKNCGKVKKYGKWESLPKEIETLLSDARVLYSLCKTCEISNKI